MILSINVEIRITYAIVIINSFLILKFAIIGLKSQKKDYSCLDVIICMCYSDKVSDKKHKKVDVWSNILAVQFYPSLGKWAKGQREGGRHAIQVSTQQQYNREKHKLTQQEEIFIMIIFNIEK